MADSTFADPDVTTFARLDDADQRCRRCGATGRPRDSTTRRLAHEPLGWRPTGPVGHGPPVPLRRVRACVASGHQQGSTAAGQALPWSTAMGVGRDRVSAPHRCQSRRGTGCLVEHCEQRRAGRGPPRADRRSRSVRRGEGHRGRRARLATYPPRRQVRHGDHRSHPGAGGHRPGPAAGHGRRTFQTGVQAMARRAG